MEIDKIIDNEKSKNKVLILGNGVSRLQYKDFIKNWKDEIWVCNRGYLEHGDFQNFTRMIGDFSPCNKAIDYKKQYHLNFDVYLRYEGWKNKLTHSNQIKKLDVPDEYRADSGSTFVIQAILEGYDEIYVAGMDLGGHDIYVPSLHKTDQSLWVDWWRRIAKEFGLDKITFIGKNHKKFILSDKPKDTYAKLYLAGKNHLIGGFKKSDNLLIIGNGKSKLLYADIINNWLDDIWVCDKLYEYYRTIIIDRVVTSHAGFAILAYLFKQKQKLNYQIFTNQHIKAYNKEVFVFEDTSIKSKMPKNSWGTYSLAINQALTEEYKKINIIGFDTLSEGVTPQKIYNKKFISEYKTILKTQKLKNIQKIKFIGEPEGFLHSLEYQIPMQKTGASHYERTH